MIAAVFWISLGLILYTLIGYPALVFLIGMTRAPAGRSKDITPRVSVIIAAYNEERTIKKKLDNTLELDYPPEKLEIIVGLDGSTDGTEAIAGQYAGGNVKLISSPARVGKTEMQNRSVSRAQGEILFFTDVTALLEKDALRKIVRNFGLPEVGCVSGGLRFRAGRDGTAFEKGTAVKGMNLYSRYQGLVRRGSSGVRTMLGATGCICAIRKNLFQPMERGLAPDFAEPIMIVEKGYRIVYEPEAVATIERNYSVKAEFIRRTRIALRGWRGLFHFRRLLNPFRHPFLAAGLISRWLLRRLLVIFLITVFITNLFLLKGGHIYLILFFLQNVFYFLGLLGFIFENRLRPMKLLYVPLFFCVANAASLIGLFQFLGGKKAIIWETDRK